MSVPQSAQSKTYSGSGDTAEAPRQVRVAEHRRHPLKLARLTAGHPTRLIVTPAIRVLLSRHPDADVHVLYPAILAGIGEDAALVAEQTMHRLPGVRASVQSARTSFVLMQRRDLRLTGGRSGHRVDVYACLWHGLQR